MRPCIIYNFRGITGRQSRENDSRRLRHLNTMQRSQRRASLIAKSTRCCINKPLTRDHAGENRRTRATTTAGHAANFSRGGPRKNLRRANRLETVQMFRQCAISVKARVILYELLMRPLSALTDACLRWSFHAFRRFGNLSFFDIEKFVTSKDRTIEIIAI